MKKLILFILCAGFALGFGACSSSETVDNSIELACPKPYVEQLLRRDVSIQWPSVAKTAGYACRIDHDGTQGEWEHFEREKLTYTKTKLANGHYQFLIYAVGDKDHTIDSQTRTIEFDINYNPVLLRPELQVVPLNNMASISWGAVANAAGYAYKLDGAEEWTKVGADVLLVKTAPLENGDHTFSIYALGSESSDTVDSEPTTVTFTIKFTTGPDYSKGVYLRVLPQGVTQPGTDITHLEGEIYPFDATAVKDVHIKQLPGTKALYTILIDGKEYGWMPFSGNGCVGTINNENAAIPFKSSPSYYAAYNVRESVGRLAEGDAGLALYANLDRQHMITFTLDCSGEDAVPRYGMAIGGDDPTVIFEHRFDLMVWGGDWAAGNTISGNRVPIDGNTPALNNVDGTEAATDHSASYTNGGTKEDWSIKSPLYDKNRHLEGWVGDKVIEHPGYLRINTGGYLKTPKFSNLTGPTNLVVEIDICRFSSAGPNTFAVEGAGTIKSCQYWKDGATVAADADVSGSPSTFAITETMANAYSASPAKTDSKKWTRLRFEIEGATAESCVGIVGVTKSSRVCIDNVVVRKSSRQ